jgi:hypothetical protein
VEAVTAVEIEEHAGPTAKQRREPRLR